VLATATGSEHSVAMGGGRTGLQWGPFHGDAHPAKALVLIPASGGMRGDPLGHRQRINPWLQPADNH